MIKTNWEAFKKACYWVHGGSGWFLGDFKGPVYSNKYGLWLETPTGYVKITSNDVITEHK